MLAFILLLQKLRLFFCLLKIRIQTKIRFSYIFFHKYLYSIIIKIYNALFYIFLYVNIQYINITKACLIDDQYCLLYILRYFVENVFIPLNLFIIYNNHTSQCTQRTIELLEIALFMIMIEHILWNLYVKIFLKLWSLKFIEKY